MKNYLAFTASAGFGAVLTLAFLQPSFASVSDEQVTRPNAAQSCAAKVGPARFTVGDRCFRDEVMVGRWDDNIYCANIEIICD